ncbi:sigma-70 family RNA polymerase sigma factor [Actinomycetes bacterium KLBMP 9797]
MRSLAATEDLIADCLGGDERAWAALVRRYAPMVGAIAGSYGLRGADRDEVVQATWVRLWRHLGTVRDRDRLAEWLGMTARREALRYLKSRARHIPTDDVGALEERPGASTEDQVVGRERADRLRTAFRQLPPRCRQMLAMLAEERSYAEIGSALGLASGSVGPVRTRCLQCLRKHLDEVPTAS